MEAVLRNVSSTVELLAVAAHSAEVTQWGELAVSRAFHWASYCEQVYHRFHFDRIIRGVLEKQLQLTNQSLEEALSGHTKVSFTDLGHCQDLLLLWLLNNPSLPVSIMKMLFDTKVSTDIVRSNREDVRGLCSRLIQRKSACRVLGPLLGLTLVGADAEVQGQMLMERLGCELSRSSDPRCAEDFLNSVLQEFEGAAQRSCLVIAAALLTTTDLAAENASQGFLLDWLEGQHDVLQRMCSGLPLKLLANLAKRHQKFGHAYCKVLKTWTSEMEYGINRGEWVHTATDSTVSFQKTTEHFLTLFQACPSLRTESEEEFRALRIADGDFDVRGVSVWGDILFALSK